MSNTQLQFKYLDAGAKSSPVVLDSSLSTSNEQTIYLYHQLRNQIIEYKRDIVEAKLRELSGEEGLLQETLQQAFEQARSSFTPRGAAALSIPDKATTAAKSAQANDDDEDSDDDIDMVDDDDLLDDDEEDEED